MSARANAAMLWLCPAICDTLHAWEADTVRMNVSACWQITSHEICPLVHMVDTSRELEKAFVLVSTDGNSVPHCAIRAFAEQYL